MEVMRSISEDRGIELLTDSDLDILSLGISTAGHAEIRMAEANPNRKIIATTIDEKGIEYTKQLIKEKGLESQITAKLENVCEPFPYADNLFDFVYSRLCLQYVNNDGMANAMSEIYRVLKPNGRAFIVVHTPDKLKDYPDAQHDEATGMTRHIRRGQVRYRRFYTERELKKLASQYNFQVISTAKYMEQTCKDYERTIQNKFASEKVEIVLRK